MFAPTHWWNVTFALNPQEFWTLTSGCQPGQLAITPWELFDNWGADFSGVLTEETEGAPRIIRVSHRRTVKAATYHLQPKHTVHERQVKDMFAHATEENLCTVKAWGHQSHVNRRDPRARREEEASCQTGRPECGCW